MELKQLEKISKALGDMHRWRILKVMSNQDGTIQCSQIMDLIDLAQPSVSHHIKTLTESGLIIPEKEGRNYTYQLNSSLFEQYIQEIGTLIK